MDTSFAFSTSIPALDVIPEIVTSLPFPSTVSPARLFPSRPSIIKLLSASIEIGDSVLKYEPNLMFDLL